MPYPAASPRPGLRRSDTGGLQRAPQGALGFPRGLRIRSHHARVRPSSASSVSSNAADELCCSYHRKRTSCHRRGRADVVMFLTRAVARLLVEVALFKGAAGFSRTPSSATPGGAAALRPPGVLELNTDAGPPAAPGRDTRRAPSAPRLILTHRASCVCSPRPPEDRAMGSGRQLHWCCLIRPMSATGPGPARQPRQP